MILVLKNCALKNITREIILELIHKNENVLVSTHSRLSLPIIERIYKKMLANLKIPPIKVSENFICDGHHRYVASILANYNLDRISWVSSSSTIIIDLDTVSFDDSDWDTTEEIGFHNRQDAAYNNLPVEEIVALLK